MAVWPGWGLTGCLRAGYSHPVAVTARRGFFAAVVAVVVATATVVWAQSRFPDVSAENPYINDIEITAERGWFIGFEDGTFGPDRPITVAQAVRVFTRAFEDGNPTRAEFAAVLRRGVRHMERIVQGGSYSEPAIDRSVATEFSDVDSDNPYADDIAFAVSRGGGWMTGDDDGMFGPDQELTASAVRPVFMRMLADVNLARGAFAAIMRAGIDALNEPATTPVVPPSGPQTPPPQPPPTQPPPPPPPTIFEPPV